MTKHTHHAHQTGHPEAAARTRQQAPVEALALTPGRAPAEGPDLEFGSPSHERWEQHTAERDPAEGSDDDAPL
jgi:hypothetical protein